MAKFKLQTANVARSAEALDPLKRKPPGELEGSEKLGYHYENRHGADVYLTGVLK
jgi:hypothetical protein